MITKGKNYKLQNWFESNQSLFSKSFKKEFIFKKVSNKVRKEKVKRKEKEKRAPGIEFGP
jgi:hypothetical protein